MNKEDLIVGIKHITYSGVLWYDHFCFPVLLKSNENVLG